MAGNRITPDWETIRANRGHRAKLQLLNGSGDKPAPVAVPEADDEKTAGEVGDPPLLTEHGVAVAFERRHKDELRYCHHTGAWYVWTDDTHWKRNGTKLAFSWARRLVADMNRDEEIKIQAITGKSAFASGVERFAQADPAFAVTSEIWDRDPFLLGTPGGTINLRTAEMLPARHGDYITKVTAVAPADAPDCPQWLAFLDQATAGDQGFIRLLQQWCGYSLTGDTREHALLFVFGTGGNGKSVFLNTVVGIMGNYATTAAMETFTASKHDRHPTDLAMLRGARMVCATETEEGRAWAETRLKQLTGGDRISARFMHKDFFEFWPQFKLLIIGNHKPRLKNVDDAARRRINMGPFVHKPAVPDSELEEKLIAEWPAILRWMIEGCLDWLKHGLVRPQVVLDATAEYFAAQDHFGQWLAECCVMGKDKSAKPSDLRKSFTEWCATNGVQAKDGPGFKELIENTKGIRQVKLHGNLTVLGVELRLQNNELAV
ncbi:MAG: hypothetical protein H0U51_10820 [Propionibacteriales bacterium]|jgi:putative DNA primase/helicase|nr:hypothetical protein [Propionibacteriales bacterium]